MSPKSATLLDFLPQTTSIPPSLFSDNFFLTKELSSKQSTVETGPEKIFTAPKCKKSVMTFVSGNLSFMSGVEFIFILKEIKKVI